MPGRSLKVALLASSANSKPSANAGWSYRASRKFLISASCSAKMKLSGLAVPSCCCGSSQREAILVCQASTILPLGTTPSAARPLRTKGIARGVVASAATRSIVRRVRVALVIVSSRPLPDGPLRLELDVFPWISISRRDRREDILPFGRGDARTDRLHCGMAEDRHEIMIFEDLALNLPGQSLTLVAIGRGEIPVEFRIKLRYAVAVPAVEAAAPHEGIVPVRPSAADPGGVHDDLHPGPLLEPALQPLQKHAAFYRLQPRADADRLQLGNDALAARIIVRHRRDPIDIEAVRITGLGHQLFGLGHIVLPFRPRHAVFDIVVDPIAVDLPQAVAFGLVDRAAIDGEADGLAHALVVKRVLGILKAGEFQPKIGRDDGC